ncbi:MAG: DUF1207 domain-containing protein [Gemmatimonadales bacterium]|nr:MAG: DUF1207 domain-containing protein [Gemmatimonadales bacterium]
MACAAAFSTPLAAPAAGQAALAPVERAEAAEEAGEADDRRHPGERLPDLAPGASRWFPDTRLFRSPRAAPLEPGLRGSALSTDLFRGDAPPGERPPPPVSGLRPGGTDFQGVVSLGDSYAVRRFGNGRGGAQVGVLVGVTARFRLATSANEYVASDWIVGLPVEFARGPVAGRAVLFHRSAHLGDEIMEQAGVRRVGFGHEGVTLLVGNAGRGPLRAYAGGTRLLRSETSGTLEDLGRAWDDAWELQGGLEFARGVPDQGSRLAGFWALDVQTAERTDWQPQWAAVAGVAFRARQRSGQVALRLLHGPSMHGEFFLTPETAWGIELSLGR